MFPHTVHVSSVPYSTVPQYLALWGPDNLVRFCYSEEHSDVEKCILSKQLLVEELSYLHYDKEARISMALIPLTSQIIM